MKKAKEYANEFVAGIPYETTDAINNKIFSILADFLNEVKEICKMRHSESNSTMLSVIKEQDRKWLSFANRVNKQVGLKIIRETGFKDYVELKIPELKGHI
jgi:hypothetical protein